VAYTLNEYLVPNFSPVATVKVHVVAGAVAAHVFPVGVEVATYLRIGVPFPVTAACHVTFIAVFSSVASTDVGAVGSDSGVTDLDGGDGVEAPAWL
jgi:hypothetical protein